MDHLFLFQFIFIYFIIVKKARLVMELNAHLYLKYLLHCIISGIESFVRNMDARYKQKLAMIT